MIIFEIFKKEEVEDTYICSFSDNNIAEEYIQSLSYFDNGFDDFYIKEKEVFEELTQQLVHISIRLDVVYNSIVMFQSIEANKYKIQERNNLTYSSKVFELNKEFLSLKKQFIKDFKERTKNLKFLFKIEDSYYQENELPEDFDLSSDYIYGLFDFSDKERPVLIKKMEI